MTETRADMPPYDLVVIGSGPAGEKGAAQAAYFGKRVALIERASAFGGAAANTGTLPSKTLRETALYLSGFRQRGLYGVTFTLREKVTARDFLHRERVVVDAEHARIRENLRRHHVDIIPGSASFVDAQTVDVAAADRTATRVRAGVFLVATGSHPYRPALFPFGDARVYDSDTILALRDIPGTMLIVGGGVIGCEYACLFAALGVRVTLVDGHHRLLGFMDREVSHALAASMAQMGIEVVLDDGVAEVLAGATLNVTLVSGRVVTPGAILVATGRTGNTADLNLGAVGIRATDRGLIEVNARFQTSVPNVYAVGDVIGFPALASTSMEQARVAMVHAFDLKYKTQLPSILPFGIYTIPECSMAGDTEEELAKRQEPFVVGRARFGENARGQIIGDEEGFLKLLFRAEDMRLMGVHVFGESASELVHLGIMALLMRATADAFIQMCLNYPTLSETYKYATYDAMGRRDRGEIGGRAVPVP